MTDTTTQNKTWRVLELINWTTDYLKNKGFTSARSDVEWLLMDVLDCERMELYTGFEKPLKHSELDAFKKLLKRRVKNEPVQYIIGETEFMGYPFKVDESVLIPRPETEILVELAADWLRTKKKEKQLSVLDIGTGSGCIGVSVAKLVENSQVTLVDVSDEALSIARENADVNDVSDRVTLKQMDVLSEEPEGQYNLILCNPPYIAKDEMETLQEDIRKYEPKKALLAESDGLIFYRRFASAGKEWLAPKGRMMLEIGGSHQSEAIQKLFEENGWSEISVHQDYNEQDRIVTVSIGETA